MGAGVIPFASHGGGVLFLFHTTFTGRRAGHLVDFGGGGHPGEGHRDTAVREFVEETETLFFDPDPENARRTPERVALQSALMRQRLDETLAAHPDWFCARGPDRAGRPRDWRTFFVEVEHRDLAAMNHAWELNPGGRFVKRRELYWVPGRELLRIYRETPERLWKRLRQMPGAPAVVEAIMAARGGSLEEKVLGTEC